MWDSFNDASRAKLFQRYVLKDADTYNITALTVMWRKIFLFVVPNWFCHNNDVKEEMRMALSSCGSISSNVSLTPGWKSKVHHWYQLQD